MGDAWQYSVTHDAPCRVIEEETLWGQQVCRVWLPTRDAVVRVPRSALRALSGSVNPETEAHRIAYTAAAAKVADVLEGQSAASGDHVLLAPMESNVIPLPHQIKALSRAVSDDRVRYLLADEVGLGKTIEAGLVMRELKLRGLVRRTLVVTPKGLAAQWASEMQTHFNEGFQLILGEDISALQRLSPNMDHRASPWSMFDQVIVTLDSVKPIDGRRGWSAERVAAHNRTRFEDLVTAGWDLVIVDEAHRLGGSTDQVARFKLGQGLAEAAPYVLLLSATPHQGKSDAFHRVMYLLDSQAFPDPTSVSRDRVAPYVIRTEKRKAIDADGKPLFKPRRTQMIGVTWESRHNLQQLLYESVTDYVREGYNRAMREKKGHIGFLMILMQRLVVSSTRAIRVTLQRRLDAIAEGQRATSEKIEGMENGTMSAESLEELYDLDGQELLEQLLKSHVAAMEYEAKHVEVLLDAARRCEQAGPDAKAEALIEWIYQLQSDENEPDLKILIFTEFVPTQAMLKEFLEARGISVTTLNGSMDLDERRRAQRIFRDEARVLVSTDAGGEGLNLQFCHVVFNYDIPWNPMRLEQRIGRVDRIGQPKVVRAINFIFEDSVEFRVREVLEEKLSVILEEFGIDKTGDVLDSAQAGQMFENVFASALLDPDGIAASVDETMARMREEIRELRESSAVYGISSTPDAQDAEHLRSHPLPHWVERMTVSYLRHRGGEAVNKRDGWHLVWPDGQRIDGCVFTSRDLGALTGAEILSLENSRVRGLALNIPETAVGQPLSRVSIKSLPSQIEGLWGLFEIRVQAGLDRRAQYIRAPLTQRRYVSVFLSDEDKLFLPTARHIWDAMQSGDPVIHGSLSEEDSEAAYERLQSAAETAGKEPFESLRQEHDASLAREEERGQTAFRSRRKAIERVGLPEVRQYRMARCEEEEREWRAEIDAARLIVPEVRPLLLLRIQPGGAA